MLSAGVGKSKDKILLLPTGTLSQHQTLVLTDGTYGNKTSQVYNYKGLSA